MTFDDIIADILTKKKPNLIVTELFIRGRKLFKETLLLFLLQNRIFKHQKILD